MDSKDTHKDRESKGESSKERGYLCQDGNNDNDNNKDKDDDKDSECHLDGRESESEEGEMDNDVLGGWMTFLLPSPVATTGHWSPSPGMESQPSQVHLQWSSKEGSKQ